MNRINIYICLAILFCFPMLSFSQTYTGRIGDHFDIDDSKEETVGVTSQIDVPTTPAVITAKKEREFNLKVWNIIRKYESNADLSTEAGKKKVSDFRALFNNGEVLLYNDLLGLSTEKRLTVTKYIELMTRQAESVECIIRNVNFGEITENASFLYRKVTFDKELSYFNECGVSLSSYNYYGKDYNEEMVLAMNKSTGECHVLEISGGIKSKKKPLGKEFFVIRNTSEHDKHILANSKSLQFDSMKQAFYEEIPTLVYKDENVKVSLEYDGGCNNIASIMYNPIRLRLKPRFSFSLGNYYSADTYGGKIDVKSSGMEFGLDFGYVLPSKTNSKLGAYLGAALSTSNASLSVENLAYSYNVMSSNADVDGDTYVRHYEFSKIEQQLSIKSIVVPAYFDYEYIASKRFTVYAQFGAKMYFNLLASTSGTRAEAFIYGVYPQYDNLHIGEPYLNGFGQKSFNEADFEKCTPNISKFNYDLFTSLGFKVSLSKRIYLDISASFQEEFGKTLIKKSMTNYKEGTLSMATTPASYTVKGGEVLRNPVDAIDLKRHFWSMNIGLIFKL